MKVRFTVFNLIFITLVDVYNVRAKRWFLCYIIVHNYVKYLKFEYCLNIAKIFNTQFWNNSFIHILVSTFFNETLFVSWLMCPSIIVTCKSSCIHEIYKTIVNSICNINILNCEYFITYYWVLQIYIILELASLTRNSAKFIQKFKKCQWWNYITGINHLNQLRKIEVLLIVPTTNYLWLIVLTIRGKPMQ